MDGICLVDLWIDTCGMDMCEEHIMESKGYQSGCRADRGCQIRQEDCCIYWLEYGVGGKIPGVWIRLIV